jgi:hypothetical protein
MQEIKPILDAIEIKIRKLLHRNENLVSENKLLLEENIKLKKELQDRFNITPKGISYNETNIPSAHSDGQKVKMIKEELDNYIEEVNECLKILEGQS